MIVLRESSPTADDADLSVFPPSSHENLAPTSENWPLPPPSPISPLSFPCSYSHQSSSAQFDSDPDRSFPQSPASSCPSSEGDDLRPPSPLSAVPRWWRLAFHIIRSKFGGLVSTYFGRKGESRFWPLRNPGVAIAAVAATVTCSLWLRARRRRRLQRGDSLGQLVQIMREKDEKIVELLNQMARLNELLIARQRS